MPNNTKTTGARGQQAKSAEPKWCMVFWGKVLVKLFYSELNYLNRRLEWDQLQGFADVSIGSCLAA